MVGDNLDDFVIFFFTSTVLMCVHDTHTLYLVLNACVKRMQDCEFLPHAQSFYSH